MRRLRNEKKRSDEVKGNEETKKRKKRRKRSGRDRQNKVDRKEKMMWGLWEQYEGGIKCRNSLLKGEDKENGERQRDGRKKERGQFKIIRR